MLKAGSVERRMGGSEFEETRVVRQFRQILVWPLQLMPIRDDAQIQNHWEALDAGGDGNPWHPHADDFGAGSPQQREANYSEFVTFLPYVQRMLYGEGKGRAATGGEAPVRVYRRSDVAAVRVAYPDGDPQPVLLEVNCVDLYFFYDLDVALLVVDIGGRDVPFDRVQQTLYRFGRSYPTYWTPEGNGGHCLRSVEWLDAGGTVLATSDYERRDKYLDYASRFRSPCISWHWEFLLRPLVLHHSDQPGTLRYRLVEYHRMPLCAFIGMDDPALLKQADFVRLAFIAPPGPSQLAPFAARELADFEQRFCIDRYWNSERRNRPGTRLLCSGESFVMVTGSAMPSYITGGPSLLEQFAHQYFLVFLMPHLHKAALSMLSDRLLQALNRMDIRDAESVRRFKRSIRQIKEIFLRFTHRYWFHEVTDQLLAKSLYRLCREHLGTETLYREVRDEIEDMSNYLDSDSIRRQANTVLRLTVVTIFGLIGTITTGFLGMNLIAEPEASLPRKLALFLLVFVPATTLTLYTIVKSKRLSDFLDALSDERLPLRGKLASLGGVWRR